MGSLLDALKFFDKDSIVVDFRDCIVVFSSLSLLVEILGIFISTYEPQISGFLPPIFLFHPTC